VLGLRPDGSPARPDLYGGPGETRVPTVLDVRPTVRLPIYFGSGSESPQADTVLVLDQVAKAVSSGEVEQFSFSLAGHSDTTGLSSCNAELSARRPEAVKAYLTLHGR
jgi:outer membrane protein OmpA-like peptidoglycan-associated protein